jgi:hypothetical protein
VNVIQPTREIRNFAMDSRNSDGFEFREGDIAITTYSKSGTTLTQQVVGQLLTNGAEGMVRLRVRGLQHYLADRFLQDQKRQKSANCTMRNLARITSILINPTIPPEIKLTIPL